MPVRRPDGCGTEQALRLRDMLEDSALDALAADGALPVLAWWDRFDARVAPFAEAIRRDHPVAALFHGPGPERARTLPGRAGDAVLTAAVRHRLPGVEAVLALAGEERTRAPARIGDRPEDDDPRHLLDGPLRVWRESASAGLGVFSSRKALDLAPRLGNRYAEALAHEGIAVVLDGTDPAEAAEYRAAGRTVLRGVDSGA